MATSPFEMVGGTAGVALLASAVEYADDESNPIVLERLVLNRVAASELVDLALVRRSSLTDAVHHAIAVDHALSVNRPRAVGSWRLRRRARRDAVQPASARHFKI